MNWDEAIRYSQLLREKCAWSPATNQYQVIILRSLSNTHFRTQSEQYACFLYAKMESIDDKKEKDEIRAKIDTLMEEVPKLKIR